MTIFYIACFCESVRGSFAMATKVLIFRVSSHGIFLQLEPSVSMMVLLFHGLWKIWVKESHDKKYNFFVTLDLKCLSQAQFKRKLVTINTNVPCLRYFYKTFLKKWRNKIIWGVLWGKNWFWQRLLAKPTLRRKIQKYPKKKYFSKSEDMLLS